MKKRRQAAILAIITEFPIATQEELQQKLTEQGFAATQATISRDIRELNLVKSIEEDGLFRYRANYSHGRDSESKHFAPILKHAMRSATAANNLIVVKTLSGMGSAVGAALDASNLEGCIGTIAGDDTVLIISIDNKAAQTICQILNHTGEEA